MKHSSSSSGVRVPRTLAAPNKLQQPAAGGYSAVLRSFALLRMTYALQITAFIPPSERYWQIIV